MNDKLKTKEFNILNDDQPKMTRVGDYWMEKEIVDIFELLKEYQDVLHETIKI
jgi:hypothetical protein